MQRGNEICWIFLPISTYLVGTVVCFVFQEIQMTFGSILKALFFCRIIDKDRRDNRSNNKILYNGDFFFFFFSLILSWGKIDSLFCSHGNIFDTSIEERYLGKKLTTLCGWSINFWQMTTFMCSYLWNCTWTYKNIL